jgi:hypothetical protein
MAAKSRTRRHLTPSELTGIWLRDGLLVAIVLTAAYLIAFRYESGFASFFEIPKQLIEISLTTLLMLGAGSTLVIVWLTIAASDLWIIRRQAKHVLNLHLRMFGVYFSTGVFIVWFFFNHHWIAWLVLLSATALIGVWTFFPPSLIFQQDQRRYLERYNALARRRFKKHENSLSSAIEQRWGKDVVTIFWFFLGGLGLAWWAGNFQASHQEEYYVLDAQPERVVLRFYGDMLITAPFNRDSRQVERQIIIQRTGERMTSQLHKEKIGPLKLRPIKNTDKPTR